MRRKLGNKVTVTWRYLTTLINCRRYVESKGKGRHVGKDMKGNLNEGTITEFASSEGGKRQ
jgi:hypothetical protein